MIKESSAKLKAPEAKLLWTLDVLGYQVPVYEAALLGVWGVFDKETREVFINRKIVGGPLAEADTVLHETLHVIENVALESSDRLAERQVNTLATVLVNTLRQNPPLRQYLWERLEDKK